MRKTALPSTLILVLLITAAAGTVLVNSASANPYSHIMGTYEGEVPPRPDTQPPRIIFYSPEYNSTLTANSVFINFTVELGESKSAENPFIWNVYYEADWLENNTYVYEYVPSASSYSSRKAEFSATLNLTEIPEGRRSIIIYATEKGEYSDPPFSEWPMWALNFTAKLYIFEITGSSPFSFNIDITPLTISLLPIETELVADSGTAEVPLNFTLSEAASKISFVLDGRDNATITGNTTLSGINVGNHNLTVYAWDSAGNVGASETVAFTVVEPFPTMPVVSLSSASIAAIATAGILLIMKRRKEATQK